MDCDGLPDDVDDDDDNDGIPDDQDTDDDNDGIPDDEEPTECRTNPDPCCGSTDPCCGSTDLCCPDPDPCCPYTDPCCGIDCDDFNSCTLDFCNGGICYNVPTADCMNYGGLSGGVITVESACVGGTVRFTVSGVTDSGGQKCFSAVPPVAPSFTWVITGSNTNANGTGPIAETPANDPGAYQCTFTATAARECAPPPLTIGPQTATAASIDLEYAGVSEANEESPGGFLCVNDDDDNNNGALDKDDPGATIGEDDLHAMSLSAGNLDPSITVTLSAVSGGSKIKVYENADRSSPVTLPATWPGDSVPSTIYVEGIAVSGWVRDVELKLEAVGGSAACADTVKLTIPDVQFVEWVEIDSILSANPNVGDGLRIFPDKLTPEDTTNQRRVIVRATITPPVQGVRVYFKAFDVDDPSANGPGPVDNDVTALPDNRGPLNQPMPTSILTDLSYRAEVEFEVSMQPGDNFRVVASCLPDYFDNLQAKQDDGTLARVMHNQGWFVPSNNRSLLLTVWRRLHIEVDSMSAVTGNEVLGTFTDFVGSGMAMTEVRGLSVSLDDGSQNLDNTPSGNGRFENGTLLVGFPPDVVISPVTGNGNYRVEFPTASLAGLPFLAADSDDVTPAETMSGTITEVTKAGTNFVWTLNITEHDETPIDWPEFENGKLSVGAGDDVTIVAVNPAASTLTTNALRIPCDVRDDDINSLLPKLPDTTTLASAYAQAYILPFFDVGDSNQTVTFRNNTSFPQDAMDWDSRPLNSVDYWVAYLLAAYQHDTVEDNDPNSEDHTAGITPLASGGSLVFIELHQPHEGIANPVAEERDTVVHETGHAFTGSGVEPVTDSASAFTPTYLDLIRASMMPRS